MRSSPMRRKTSLSGATILGWLAPATCRPVWVNSVGGSNGSGGGVAAKSMMRPPLIGFLTKVGSAGRDTDTGPATEGADTSGTLSVIVDGWSAPQIDSSVGSELVTDGDGCPLAASLLSASAAVTTGDSAAGLGAGSANGLGAADAEGATGLGAGAPGSESVAPPSKISMPLPLRDAL